MGWGAIKAGKARRSPEGDFVPGGELQYCIKYHYLTNHINLPLILDEHSKLKLNSKMIHSRNCCEAVITDTGTLSERRTK